MGIAENQPENLVAIIATMRSQGLAQIFWHTDGTIAGLTLGTEPARLAPEDEPTPKPTPDQARASARRDHIEEMRLALASSGADLPDEILERMI